MEELLLALFSAVAEVLFEAFFQIASEAAVVLIVRSIRNVFEKQKAIHPVLAAMGHLFLGVVFGIASLRFLPHPLFHPSKFHGISLIVSPLLTGLVMSQVGAMLRRSGRQAVRIESFGYGFTFALGMAVIRLIFVR
jgi:hypothetical protein